MSHNLQITSNHEMIKDNLVLEGSRYLNKFPVLRSLVIGVSGGVDSAVTAALARLIADKTGVKVYGCVLPIITNSEEEIERGIEVAENYCDEYSVNDFSDGFINLLDYIDPTLFRRVQDEGDLTLDEKIQLGNIKARIRMIHLYNQARTNRGIVLSTDNYTELLLGFWTLHGDVGDFGLLQNLWKTEVYGLADHLGGACIATAQAKPTDGLGISNSDLEQLLPGWYDDGEYRTAYKYVDDVLIDYMTGGGVHEPTHPIVQRCKNTQFKRDNPMNVARDVALWRYNPASSATFVACL